MPRHLHAPDNESNMQRPAGEAFPTAFQAVLLYVALLLCELFVGAALRDMRGIVRLAPDQASALTLVLANGCVFVVVMHFQNITYRSLFHHSSASRRATLALIVPPALLLVPAMMLTISAALELLVRIAPMSIMSSPTPYFPITCSSGRRDSIAASMTSSAVIAF